MREYIFLKKRIGVYWVYLPTKLVNAQGLYRKTVHLTCKNLHVSVPTCFINATNKPFTYSVVPNKRRGWVLRLNKVGFRFSYKLLICLLITSRYFIIKVYTH